MRKVIEKRVSPIFPKEYEIKPEGVPVITGEDYQNRIAALLKLAKGKYSHIVVYADREHFANMEYLSGFDPRFEEALLVVTEGAKPTLVVGLEGEMYCTKINFPVNVELFTTFGLAGQPRNQGKRLKEILQNAGINKSAKVGLTGWKYYTADDFADFEQSYDIPHYIVETIKELSGGNVSNATDLFTDCEYGMRHNLDAKEIVLSEIANSKVSRGTFNVIKNLKAGMSEIEASLLLQLDGDPLCTHPALSFGMPNVSYALGSPTYHKKLEDGDVISVGASYRRSMIHRLCSFVDNEAQLPKGSMDSFYKPYFMSTVNWYETVGIGVRGGDVYKAAEEPLGSYKDFGVVLNPGHLIHTDEWSNAPLYQGSEEKLHSGMLVQCDYTVAKGSLYAHIEDGIAIADAALRDEIARIAPESMARINARRTFMIDTLGIKIKDEILPLSDIQGMMFIYAKDPSIVLAMEA